MAGTPNVGFEITALWTVGFLIRHARFFSCDRWRQSGALPPCACRRRGQCQAAAPDTQGVVEIQILAGPATSWPEAAAKDPLRPPPLFGQPRQPTPITST